MPDTVTIRKPLGVALPEGQSSTFDVPSEIEAQRIAQEGVLVAHRRAQFVTFEVHDDTGRLVVPYTSATVDS